MGRYRYQILDTIDTRVSKKSIEYLAGNIDYFDTAEPAVFLIVSSGLVIKMGVDPWCYAHEIIDLNFTIFQQSSNDLSYP